MSDQPNPGSCSWGRFRHSRIGRLILLVVVIGAGVGWIVHCAHIQRDAVAAIREAGREAWYQWEWRDGRFYIPETQTSWPKWLVQGVGIDYLTNVVCVNFRGRGSDALLPQIANLDQLEKLDLRRSHVSDAGLAHLKGLRHLKVLD